MVMSLDWIIVSDLLMVFTGGDLCRAQCYPLRSVFQNGIFLLFVEWVHLQVEGCVENIYIHLNEITSLEGTLIQFCSKNKNSLMSKPQCCAYCSCFVHNNFIANMSSKCVFMLYTASVTKENFFLAVGTGYCRDWTMDKLLRTYNSYNIWKTIYLLFYLLLRLSELQRKSRKSVQAIGTGWVLCTYVFQIEIFHYGENCRRSTKLTKHLHDSWPFLVTKIV